MNVYTIAGPFDIPVHNGKGAKFIGDDEVERFWDAHSKYRKRRGCYVFGVKPSRGFTPGYVGKASKTFEQEVFTWHKLNHYHGFLADYGKGKPVMFFVLAPQKQGKPNSKQIGQIEKYLIDLAVTANADLRNEKDAKPPSWGIKGVVRGGKGKTSAGTRDFRRMLGVE